MNRPLTVLMLVLFPLGVMAIAAAVVLTASRMPAPSAPGTQPMPVHPAFDHPDFTETRP